MKTQYRHIIIFFAFTMALLGFVEMAQAQTGTHYYISLYQSKVNITAAGKMNNGKVWLNGAWTQLTDDNAIPINSNDVYEIGMWESGDPAASNNPSAGTYNKVTTTCGGTVNIVNRSEKNVAVLSEWDTEAARIGYRSTSNNIEIGKIGTSLTICLNNCWTTASRGLVFWSQSNNSHLEVQLKGDNRFQRIEYLNSFNYPDATITFKQAGTGTLTVGGANGDNCVIGSCNGAYEGMGGERGCDACGIVFESGTIYAGADGDNSAGGYGRCTAIGGGGNKDAKITICGATVTAVSSTRGATIGGGMGGTTRGGAGTVIITSGTVYAYNYGSDIAHNSAIGGGSSNATQGSSGTVTISGGTVYAESVGGAAIGGGSSRDVAGGDAILTISETANVTAKSVAGTTSYGALSATTAIGGGTGNTQGGNVSFTMTGGTLKTGSVGGGQKGTTGTFGSGSVNISGGTINGQFLLSPPASGHSEFTMSGGTIGGQLSGYTYIQSDGYALWMNDPNGVVTMSGGIIDGCTGASDGGAIYLTNGSFTMSGDAKIQNCSTTNDGGAVYMNNGSFTMEGSAKIQNCSATRYGGALYLDDGTVTIQAVGSNVPSLDGNSAYAGGALFMNAGNCTITACNIGTTSANHATQNGGGIHTNGTLSFSNGNISNNWAGNNGGGVYITSIGEIDISGTANITGNNVRDGQGGGVYQNNIMTANGSSLNISGNTKGTAKALSTNNVYLPDNKTIKVGSSIDPTGVTLGIYTQHQANEVSGNKIAVLTADAVDIEKLSSIYTALQGGTSRITDDRMVHQPHYTSPETILYFTMLTFDRPAYTKAFVGPISNVDSLYKYMCWVNGVNGFTSPHNDATGDLTADISMSGISRWIPIGSNSAFIGQFNGNGHVIRDLTIDGIGGYANYGLFAQTAEGAEITDLFVSNINLTKSAPNGGLGAIVGTMAGGTISGCVASGNLTTTATDCTTGGLVGKQTGGVIQSSSAMAQMTGYTMGGIAGTNSGNIYNSFANPEFTHSGTGTEYVGGLVAENTGRIENCYVRLERTQSLGTAHFGMLAGSNTGSNTIVYCYAPNGDAAHYDYLYGGTTTGLSNCDYYNKVIAPYKYNNSNDNTLVNASTSNLLAELNRWVGGHSGYSPWKRTRAGGYITGQDINGDYPIHKYSDYHCVASTDGINLDYATTLDAMLSRHNTDGTTINLYAFDAADVSGNNAHTNTATGVVVYVDEDVCVLPEADKDVRANTCQTLGTYSSSRWHDVSSSLQNSKIGFTYGSDNELFSWDPNPCSVTLDSDNNESLFPTDLGDLARCDLYCFYEPEYHWLNLKRNTNSHWHMNATTEPIDYIGNGTGGNGNEDHLVPGKGYLVSVDKDQLLENEGILNRGNVTLYNVTKSDNNAWAGRLGFNLLGNPYQSYLDFEEFKRQNATSLWEGTNEYNNTYAVFDPSQNAYVQYKSGASVDANTASQYIHPHQGFFIRMTKGTNSSTTVTYTNAMRTMGDYGAFRNEESPAYPLVNFLVRDSEGNGDVAVLELGRDNDEGTHKMRLGDCTGKISLALDGNNFGILFRTEVEDYQSLRFEATEEGIFTLTWNTANAKFDKLTLIDNITGTTTDMLGRDSYSFEATPDQYASRFKVVIGDYKGIDEPEVPEPVEGPACNFAFQMGDQLVVSGEGNLQIIDMLGRVVMTDQLTGSQSTTSLPSAAGVYVLRLTDTNGTRMQKMVIR